ncbi:MAG TPA: M56 family metallopeptidase [Candidatus Acidoferrales bacterium]|nr:M56 family metallopeptidase [Candidatus Acidoferrales bacterium]
MTSTLAHATSTFLAYLAEPAVRSLVLGSVAAFALLALRVKRAPARLQVWTAVLFAALAMPFLGIMLPRMPLAIPARTIERVSREIPLPVWQPILERGKLAAKANGQQMQEPVRVVDANTANIAQSRTERSEGVFSLRVSARSEALRQIKAGPALRAQRLGRKRANYIGLATASSFRRITGHPVDADSFAAASMPVMPLPALPVIAEPGISPAQMAAMVALGIYGFVALILLARLFAGMWLSGKLERAAQEIEPLYFSGADDGPNAQACEALRMLRFRSSFSALKIAPALKESAAISVPATVGVRRAAILLPLNWRAWTSEQLDAVLAHEVSHVARRDALVQTLSLVHRAIFWFSPLAWWLDRQLTELAEQASDEAALAGGADRTRYAETLLGFFAQLENAQGRIWWQGVSMAKKSHAGRAERRVDRILAWKEGMSMKKSFAVAVAALAAPVIFLAASLHPVIAYGQDKTQSDARNLILPGGPKAPALPKAPKGGVTGPALPAAPQGGVPAAPAIASAPESGAVAPAMPPAPKAPAPGAGVENPGPMPPAPQGGVVAPPLPAAPTGPITVRPDVPAPAPVAPQVPSASIASITPMAPVTPQNPSMPQSTHTVVGDTADDRAIEEQLRAAQKALRDAEQQVEASNAQVRDAREALRKAQAEATQADSQQVQTAEDNLEKAEKARADLEQAREDAVAQVRAAEEAYRDARRAQLQAAKQARVAAEAQREATEQARRDMDIARKTQEEAERAQEDAHNAMHVHGDAHFFGYGSRYVIMSGADEGVEMSGDDEDFHHAQELRKKLGKDLIWFERDEKSYVITDPAFIAKAKALFAPEEALAKQQDELGREQDALGKQQDALGEQMDKVSVKPPDITPDLQRIQARLKELEASGATQSELGRIQSELGALQSEIGHVQSEAGVQQSAIGRQQSDLGRKQSELGRKQGELGRQQGQIAREANRQLRSMFEDAIASGIAKPE